MKRIAHRQITKDHEDDEDDEDDENPESSALRASAEVLANRRLVKAKRYTASAAATPASPNNSNPFASVQLVAAKTTPSTTPALPSNSNPFASVQLVAAKARTTTTVATSTEVSSDVTTDNTTSTTTTTNNNATGCTASARSTGKRLKKELKLSPQTVTSSSISSKDGSSSESALESPPMPPSKKSTDDQASEPAHIVVGTTTTTTKIKESETTGKQPTSTSVFGAGTGFSGFSTAFSNAGSGFSGFATKPLSSTGKGFFSFGSTGSQNTSSSSSSGLDNNAAVKSNFGGFLTSSLSAAPQTEEKSKDAAIDEKSEDSSTQPETVKNTARDSGTDSADAGVIRSVGTGKVTLTASTNASQLPVDYEPVSGEEQEQVLMQLRCKTFRWGSQRSTTSTVDQDSNLASTTSVPPTISPFTTTDSRSETPKKDKSEPSDAAKTTKCTWHEVGIGPLRVLSDASSSATRIVQRRESTINGPASTVLWNVKLWKESTVKQPDDKRLIISSLSGSQGQPILILVKCASAAVAADLFQLLTDRIPTLQSSLAPP